jgi:hypothetical protein
METEICNCKNTLWGGKIETGNTITVFVFAIANR